MVAHDPAPMAPIGGLALGQLGSVEAVLALQSSSGNQAVNRVMTGQAGTGEATLPGALGAALVASRPAAKPAARKRAGAVGRQVADDLGAMLRNAAAGRLAPEARAAQSLQSASPVDAGAVTATAGGGGFGGFAGAGFVDPAGLDGGVAGYGGSGGATGGHRIAAGASSGDASEAGSDFGDDAADGVDGGATGADSGGPGADDEMDADMPGDGDAGAGGDAGADDDADAEGGGETGSRGRLHPAGASQLARLGAHTQIGARAVDYFAEENAGATAWVDQDGSSDAGRAASGATRDDWARRQRGHTTAPRRIAQLPDPSADDPVERRRQVDAFRDMAGAGAVIDRAGHRHPRRSTRSRRRACATT